MKRYIIPHCKFFIFKSKKKKRRTVNVPTGLKKYVYPFVIHMEKDSSGIDFWGEFPDIPGCFTQGKDTQDIMYMAEDALSLVLFHYEMDKTEIPTPTANLIPDNPHDIVKLITADTDKFYPEERRLFAFHV